MRMTKGALRTGDGPSVYELDKAQVRLEEQLKAIGTQMILRLDRLQESVQGLAGAAQDIKEINKKISTVELDVKGLMTTVEVKSEFRNAIRTVFFSVAGLLVGAAIPVVVAILK
jgi:uncharacterized protein (UPF0335 family)